MAKRSTVLKGAALLRANWPALAVPDDTDELWVMAFAKLEDADFIAAIESWIDHQHRPYWPCVNEVKGLAARNQREREEKLGCGDCLEGLRYRERDDGARIMYPCECPAGESKRLWLSGEKDEPPGELVSIPSDPLSSAFKGDPLRKA